MQLRHIRPVFLLIGLVIMGLAIAIMVRQTFSKGVPPVNILEQTSRTTLFKLSSPVFDAGGPIPASYTCSATNVILPLSIQNPPENTKEFAIIMHDQDTATGDFTHWVVWNIPSSTTQIAENSIPESAVIGKNQLNNNAFEPICPVKGNPTHRYTYDLYALNEPLKLDSATTKDGLIAAMNGRVIAKTQLVGTAMAAQ